MNKMSIEILTAVGSVAVFIILIVAAKLIIPAFEGYGFAAALLIFVVIMSIAGLKLAEIQDK
ncbi:hypothetical protein [Candidatus Methanoperedens nitratireducens]|uniref:Uncharacterized protein n=1 Tax=Candidatus Methanoperedens nitratireducens TaxID=1392998 RepID=A0A284VRM7_9EURY|nr:hypothetical protein [Candidatus Methanoperedens nitroreducens]SNQ61944.1 conserved hypothetical protein [Candidatus Methanoperedens nitroreducens]